jgi:glycosyltransferase 2 family protein
MNRRAWIRWIVGLAVSGVFLWLAFRSIDLGEVGRTIAAADQAYLAPAVLATLGTMFFRGWRWQLCFAPEDRVTFPQASAAYGVGITSAQVIPARLGDLVRIYVLGQCSSVSKSKALGTLVVERLSDLAAVVILLAALIPFFSLPSWIKVADAFAAVVTVVVLVVVFLLARHSSDLPEPRWVTSRQALHKAFGLLQQVLEGFSAIKDARRALMILGLSFALWLMQTGTYAISFGAVHIPLGWKEGALMTFVLALTAIIPTGPGFAGSFEIAAQQLLGLFAVDRALATAYLEYTRIPSLIAVVVFAMFGLLTLKLSRPRSEPGAPVIERASTAAKVAE